MDNKKDFEYHFYWDNEENPQPGKPKAPAEQGGFEDISSNTGVRPATDNDFVGLDDFSSGGRHYRKKKRGIAAFFETVRNRWHALFDPFNDGWHRYSAWSRFLFTMLIVLAAIGYLVAVWALLPLGIRGRLVISLCGLLALDVFFYSAVRWKKRTWQRILASVTSTFMAAVIIFGTFFPGPFWNLFYNYDYDFDNGSVEALPQIDQKITNIALFGIDTRDKNSFKGLSDSIMILSLNIETHTVKITSVMRDSLIPIENNGKTTYGKINSAYSIGGPELAVKTINKIFNLDIKEYATVNFFGMAKMIDAVGGMDVELTEKEVKARGDNNHGINDMIAEICGYMGYNANDYIVREWGKQHLNGLQAVAYSRIRYVKNIWGSNNDYGRTERQRYVMEQLFNKALTLEKSSYKDMITALIPYTRTSMDPDEILSFAQTILWNSPSFMQARLPLDEAQMTSPKGSFGSVVYYDLDFASELLHAFIYADTPFEDYVAQNGGIGKNDWYAKATGHKPSGNTGSSKPSTNVSSGTTSSSDSSGTSSVVESEPGSGQEERPEPEPQPEPEPEPEPEPQPQPEAEE